MAEIVFRPLGAFLTGNDVIIQFYDPVFLLVFNRYIHSVSNRIRVIDDFRLVSIGGHSKLAAKGACSLLIKTDVNIRISNPDFM
jgi:hypothetical protein